MPARATCLLLTLTLLAPSAVLASKHQDRDPDNRVAAREQPLFDRFRDVAVNHGFADGYEKGEDDAHGNKVDPTRHLWYRSATRGYDSRYGSQDEYRELYRNGFKRGYDEGYREARRERSSRR